MVLEFSELIEQGLSLHDDSEAVGLYIREKTEDLALQQEILNRSLEVARGGSLETSNRIRNLFENSKLESLSSQDLAELQPEAFVKQVLAEHAEFLAGQESKLQRAEIFISNMTTWSEGVIEAQSTLSAEQKDEVRQKLRLIILDAARAITFQDTKASGVTLGDHGWMHLVQDLQDAVTIADSLADQGIDDKQKLVLGLAAAYHDIGYAMPQVSDPQLSNNGKYGNYDKGHPVYSYVYLRQEKRGQLLGVFDEQDVDSLEQIIINHENPERASAAGDQEVLARAFAIADAGAAFGKDKLPPVINQIPEAIAFLHSAGTYDAQFDTRVWPYFPEAEELRQKQAQITELEDELKNPQYQVSGQESLQDQVVAQLNQLRQQVNDLVQYKQELHQNYQQQVLTELQDQTIQAIDERVSNPQQADALKNAFSHLGPISLRFLLGRMSAESMRLRVQEVAGEKMIVFDIVAGFARELEGGQGNARMVEGSITASAALTFKLFKEQAALELPADLERAAVEALAKNTIDDIDQEQLDALASQGVQLANFNDTTHGKGVLLRSGQIVINSFGERAVSSESKDFYDTIKAKLAVANQATVEFINQAMQTRRQQ